MSTFVQSARKLYVAEFDLSGDMQGMALSYGAVPQDDTVYGDATRSSKGGLKTVRAQHEGLWQGGDGEVDDVLFDRIGVADVPMTLGPVAGAAGEVGYFFKALTAEYTPGASVGELFKFSVSAEASKSPLVRGTILHNAAQTVSGNGTAYQVGAVSATQKLYAALHVIAASGTPTLDVIVQSDDASGMASATNRITFAQATGVTSEWATPVAGAITDDWWRVSYTIGGSDPNLTFVVVIGIL